MLPHFCRQEVGEGLMEMAPGRDELGKSEETRGVRAGSVAGRTAEQ